MKVAKRKKSQPAKAAKSGPKSALLPLLLKKKLENSRGAGVIMFEEADHGNWKSTDQELEIAIAAKDAGKSFNIRLAESSLDVYRSPHLIDLSRRQRATDGMNYIPETEFGYGDMPWGRFLERYHILDFWDFQRSEILNAIKFSYGRIKSAASTITMRPEFSPLLIGEKKAAASKSHLEETALVGLLLFFSDIYYGIYESIRKILLIGGLLAHKSLSRDHTIYLPQADKAPQPASGFLDRLAAAGHEPTIAELIKAKQSGPANSIADGKFRIINYSVNRKKEIKEKYLTDNFSRKGVLVASQQPAAPWPKESIWRDFSHLLLSRSALKPAAVVIGVLIALTSSVQLLSYFEDIYNVKGKVMGEAELALTSIDSAAADLKSLDFNAARDKFLSANSNFVSAQNRLDEIKSFLTVLAEIAPAENTFKSGTNIIDMGEHLSNAASRMLSGVGAASADEGLSLASRIKNLSLAVLPALEELKAAQSNSEKIGVNNLTAEQKDKFIKLKAALPEAIAGLQKLSDSAAFAVQALGDNDVRRYLLVFQNDNELRATGGFMGSFALADLRGGKIEKITIPAGGTYDVRAGFNQLVAPPEPLRLVADRWEFQDANWWPDFPTSAKNIKWFYEKSGGPTVDGVIAINSSFLGELLKLTGPINLPAYGKIITTENFEQELQKSIELEAKEKTKPKKILGELAPLLMDKLINSDPKQFFSLAEALSGGLKRRDIQMYFIDNELQSFAAENDWAGEMISPLGSDFLSVVAANIGGGKTDENIRQKIYHSAEIGSDGSIIDTVLIERRNIGPTDDYFTTNANNSYIRVYVPQGSVLLHAAGFKGFEADKFRTLATGTEPLAALAEENSALIDPESGLKVYNENGQTVFADWSVVGQGERRELLLVYKLPFKLPLSGGSKNLIEKTADLFSAETAAYSWKFRKQSGRDADEISSVISYPKDLRLKLSYPEALTIGSNTLTLSGQTVADKFLVAGFIK